MRASDGERLIERKVWGKTRERRGRDTLTFNIEILILKLILFTNERGPGRSF